MNKKDLRLAAGVSTAVIAKLGKGENLTTDVLLKICNALDCDIADIMEIERKQIVTTDGGKHNENRTQGKPVDKQIRSHE
jgi:DNA-binding Xre family transcriptional regulator